MSPKVHRVTPGVSARAMALSRSALAVTQTGQPGPDNMRTLAGRSWRMPWRKMATVWVPQTSIRFTGRLV